MCFVIPIGSQKTLRDKVLDDFAGICFLRAIIFKSNECRACFGKLCFCIRRRTLRTIVLNGLFTAWAVLCADPGKEQLQEIRQLRDRCHGGAGGANAVTSVDCNSGQDPLNALNFGLTYSIQKLPRISGKRFDIAPLSLGPERLKCQRAFA